MMKKTIAYIVLALCLLSAHGCRESYVTYEGDEYVMFADTVLTYAVRENAATFEVPVVSTVVLPYDRTFAVEIIDEGSTAIEGRDYSLESNTFTIKAGENTAMIRVTGRFDRLDQKDAVSFNLRLVMPERLVLSLYGDRTRVAMKKSCGFNRENFTGWAVVTSSFLYYYSVNGQYQRLIQTSADPDDENTVILHNYLFDGYDVKISFDDSDPLKPTVRTLPGQVLSDEASVFGIIYGDNHILVETAVPEDNYFLGCTNIAVLVQRVYVQKLGDDIGTVGTYMSEIDWVSDEEAERLRKEEGF